MNNQKQESKIESDGSILEVHSIFKTIQGEGPFSGTPAIFVRLAGCNLQCKFCDTDYTSYRANVSYLSISNDVIKLAENTIKLVVITGGEPFRQNITKLIENLLRWNFFVQIETNGTIEPPLEIVYNHNLSDRRGIYVVCSPKTLKLNSFYHKISCAFKYVLNHNHIADDGLPTSVLGLKGLMVARPNDYFRGLIYLSPEDMGTINYKCSLNTEACIESCLKHGYILNLQIHKILRLQ